MNSKNSNAKETPTVPNYQMTPETAKYKCKIFLKSLLKLVEKAPPQIAKTVKNLVQFLIDDKIAPQAFTIQLARYLNSSPKQCLVPFLTESMPVFRQALKNGEFAMEFSIEGIVPPSNPVTFRAPEQGYLHS